MAYDKNNWVDQVVERPKTYEMTNNADGSVTLIDSFGLVSELGTPVNATNMNHIEEGIAACDLRKYNAVETFDKGEWVTSVTDGTKKIYESFKDNNFGHPVTDVEWWKEVDLGGGASLDVVYDEETETLEFVDLDADATQSAREAAAAAKQAQQKAEEAVNEINTSQESLQESIKQAQAATSDIDASLAEITTAKNTSITEINNTKDSVLESINSASDFVTRDEVNEMIGNISNVLDAINGEEMISNISNVLDTINGEVI